MGRSETAEKRQARHALWQAALNDADLSEAFVAISRAAGRGELTLAQLGDFGDEQLSDAHAAACQLVNTGRVPQALQVAGYLIMLQPWHNRSYYLAGVCFHHLGLHARAIDYYQVALSIEPDALTLLCLGEARLMDGQLQAARQSLRQALEMATKGDPPQQDCATRARQLLSTYIDQNHHQGSPT